MIVVFTSNIDGGIVQFAIQLTTELLKNKISCKCFIPKEAVGMIPQSISDNIVRYKKFKAVSQTDRRIHELANQIIANEPSLIWYIDSSILSAEICSQLAKEKNKNFSQLFTVHDPSQDHPTNKISMHDRLKRVLVRKRRKIAFEKSDKIVTLSPESGRQFRKIFPKYRDKEIVFNLGAHIPDADEQKPDECTELDDSYILFFGRIDKYKGIENLLCAFNNRKNSQQRLVIAGKGDLTEKEEELANITNNLVLINRYIKDEEQIWLFKHAKALILPYIEASQSGIIPIAYKFGVPVIVSDIPGLTQFVENKKTGVVCNSIEEITEAIDNIDQYKDYMKTACMEYYKTNLEWWNSIQSMFESVGYKNEVING